MMPLWYMVMMAASPSSGLMLLRVVTILSKFLCSGYGHPLHVEGVPVA